MNSTANHDLPPFLAPKKAMITGIAGQDGSYLAELLFGKGYEVYGIDKSIDNLSDKTKDSITSLFAIDLIQPKLIKSLILDIAPDEIYHLAAYHFSTQQDGNRLNSFLPFNAINLLVTNEILETINKTLSNCRFFFASSSHIFGNVDHYPQNEKTPYKPESFYAITKAAGNELCRFFRAFHNVYASVGILYNHESPHRPLSFVTAQIAEAAAKASLGLPVKLFLKDINAIVDWGAAQDYVNAMWLTLQRNSSDDYIIASGKPHSIREFSKIAFAHFGLNYKDYVFQEPSANICPRIPLIGDSSKLKNECKWTQQIGFHDLVIEMVNAHLNRLSQDFDKQ